MPRACAVLTGAIVCTQANTLTPFLQCVRSSLDAAMCLRSQPSQNVERHNQPEVETRCVGMKVGGGGWGVRAGSCTVA